jgi:hypothetical protein
MAKLMTPCTGPVDRCNCTEHVHVRTAIVISTWRHAVQFIMYTLWQHCWLDDSAIIDTIAFGLGPLYTFCHHGSSLCRLSWWLAHYSGCKFSNIIFLHFFKHLQPLYPQSVTTMIWGLMDMQENTPWPELWSICAKRTISTTNNRIFHPQLI